MNQQDKEYIVARFEVCKNRKFKIKKLYWKVKEFQHLIKLLKNSVTEKYPRIDIYEINEDLEEIPIASLVSSNFLTD